MSIAFFNKFYLFGPNYLYEICPKYSLMQSLSNYLLGIVSLKTILSLKELSEGKGRRSIVEALKEELRLEHPDEGALNKLVEREIKTKEKEKLNDANLGDLSDEQKKGVVFILDHMRKMKKAQRILKSQEIMNRYKRTFSSGKQAGNDFKASKGILVNKKQY